MHFFRRLRILLPRSILRGCGLLVVFGLGLFLWMAWSRSALEAPSPTLLLVDRQGLFLAQTGSREAYGYWPLEQVPPRVAAAILAVEDQRFHEHWGIDPRSVGRAVWERLSGSGRSGASTLAMQVARMQSPGARTLPRKGLEATTALMMTLRHGREAVLRHYLRLVPFGNQSHGIAHAARWYLDKPMEDLSWAEIAFLTGIPQAPGRMNPFTEEGRARAIARGHKILARLHDAGSLSAQEFALAEQQIESIFVPDRPARPPQALHAILRLEAMLKATPPPHPRVVTSLDLAVQTRLELIARQFLAGWRSQGAEQLAVIVQDRETREVLAYLGSADYTLARGGAIDFARVERSPGSALKPFIYALALEQGTISANTVLADLPETQWGIENADHAFLGPLLPRQALATSRNLPVVAVLRRVGVERTYDFFRMLGLHDGKASASRYGLVLAVGALSTTLDRLVRAYGALADDGRLVEPLWWRGQQTEPPRRVLSAATARQVALFLSDPMARLPTFPRLMANREGLTIAVKTGTSQGFRDAWAVGWTGRALVGVWTGRVKGNTMQSLTGAQSAAALAQSILLDLHQRQPNLNDFPPPEGYQPVELCAQTGLRSLGNCAQTLTEWFPDGHLPEEDHIFQRVRIDLRNGLLAGPWTPLVFTGERVFAAFPPEHAAWGESQALPLPPSALSMLNAPGTVVRHLGRGTGPAKAILRVVAPVNGLRMMRNPETPPEANVINLRAAVSAGIDQVTWLVDGTPWQTTKAQTAVLWPLQPGEHRFEVVTPDGGQRSAPIRIWVE